MPILDVQKRYRELGRLRLGKKNAKGNPVRLGTWRFTSPDQRLLDAAAVAFGGQVQSWTGAPTEGEQWELLSETKELRVYVPPQDLASSMFYERWNRGGVNRRCDGETEYLAGVDCLCNREGKKTCSITTHLAVMLPQLPDVGVWRVRTSSWNAAAEIPSTVDLLQRIHDEGALPLAILGIESRTQIQEGKTKHFALPVLRYPSSIAEAEAAGIPILSHRRDQPELEAGRPELPADARFDRDRAEWGDAVDIPAVEGTTVEKTDSGDVGVEAASDPGKGPAEPPGEKTDEAPPAGRPEEAATPATAGQGSGGESSGGDGPDPDPWSRLQVRSSAISDDGRAAVRRHAISHRWGWPPAEDWPADRLEALAELAREWEDAG